MAKTTNIGLNLTEDESTKFSDWRKTIDGNGSGSGSSNMQILDREIGTLKTSVQTHSSEIGTLKTSVQTHSSEIGTLKTSVQTFGGDIADLKTKVGNLLYEPIVISSFMHNKSTLERGVTVSSVTLSWSTNKTPTSLTLDGSAVDVASTSKEISGLSIKWDNKPTWTLVATDERGETSEKTTSLNFQNGVYWGVSVEPSSYTSEFILGLSDKELRGNKKSPIAVNAGAEQYIYYCVPTRFGECTFTVGVLSGGFSKVATIEFTNASGYTEEYYIYKSNNANLGSTEVKVS